MGKRIVVTSGKGGVGKSSVSCGCAAALARMGKRVLLIDADIGLRSLDVMLGTAQRTVNHWGDLLTDWCPDDEAIIQVNDALPLFVLAAPFFSETYPDAQEFAKLCERLADKFDYIFIDSPAGLGRGFVLAAAGAEEAIVVVTPDPVCIRSAGITASHAALRDKPSKLILNRFRTYPILHRSMPNIDDAIDETGLMLLGIVPEDAKVAYSAGQGLIIPENCRAAKAFKRISGRMLGEEIHLKYF